MAMEGYGLGRASHPHSWWAPGGHGRCRTQSLAQEGCSKQVSEMNFKHEWTSETNQFIIYPHFERWFSKSSHHRSLVSWTGHTLGPYRLFCISPKCKSHNTSVFSSSYTKISKKKQEVHFNKTSFQLFGAISSSTSQSRLTLFQMAPCGPWLLHPAV